MKNYIDNMDINTLSNLLQNLIEESTPLMDFVVPTHFNMWQYTMATVILALASANTPLTQLEIQAHAVELVDGITTSIHSWWFDSEHTQHLGMSGTVRELATLYGHLFPFSFLQHAYT